MLSKMFRMVVVAILVLLAACSTQEVQKAPISTGTQGSGQSLPATAQNVGTILSIGNASIIDPQYQAQPGWQYARVAFGDSLATAQFKTAVAPASLPIDIGDVVEVQVQPNGAVLITRVLTKDTQ